MIKFIVDANLPYFFNLWNNKNYIHLFDINDRWTDSQLWNYSKRNNLTIITKDTDFSNRMLISTPPPKVIHIRLGNIKIDELYRRLNNIWKDVLNLNKTHKLVNVFSDRIEGIK
jgi:predicted nuclease of predicted toxin-antitoxin system